MPTFRFVTAGESHGPALTAVVEGVPAGLPLRADDVDRELRRRQGGYGRGGRMRIESDRAEILSGVRHGETLGSPVSLLVRNRDWANWTEAMSPSRSTRWTTTRRCAGSSCRGPGHADLVGALKYGRTDARDVLERASARETAARVAAGAVAKRLLEELGITVGSHVVALGGIEARTPGVAAGGPERRVRPIAGPLPGRGGRGAMIDAIDAAKRAGDTLGGVVEVVARGVPAGLGSHVSWDRKLDGRLAGALMSIQAIKGVEVGLGFEAARAPARGCTTRSPWTPVGAGGRVRARGEPRRRAGGRDHHRAPLVVRAAMKPISTLMQPLQTVDLRTGEPAEAVRERSDVCAVPAAGVVARRWWRSCWPTRCWRSSAATRWRSPPQPGTATWTRSAPWRRSPEPDRRVVLVGMMGRGRRRRRGAGARLGWTHVDLDARWSAATAVRRPIFAEEGEARFRALEAEAAGALAGRARVVVSTGGGWGRTRRSAARPGRRGTPPARRFRPPRAVRRLLAERERRTRGRRCTWRRRGARSIR
jgi:chorismate synthase